MILRDCLALAFPPQDCFDIQTDRILTRSQSKKKRLHPELENQYRFICREVTFDYIEPDSGKEYPLSLCVLRFKVSGNGNENIITNLPQEEFPPSEIKNLYGLRWGLRFPFGS